MTRRKRGCLAVLAVLALIGAAGVVSISLFLPGELHLGGFTPEPGSAPAAAPAVGPPSPVTSSTPPSPSADVPPSSGGGAPSPVAAAGVPSPAAAGAVPVVAAPAAVPPVSGWLTYVIPGDILEAEVRKAFPIRQNVVDLVKLQLDRPTFVADPDGAFLRVTLAVEARILDGGQVLPGRATVRTQLAYHRGARRVTLRNAQLVELSFAGGAASAGGVLQPVLAQALAAEMEGYPIFEVPADGLWWLKTGVGFVRDVYVRDGRVCLSLGP